MATDARQKPTTGQASGEDEDIIALAAMISSAVLIAERVRCDAVTALLRRALAALTAPRKVEALPADEPAPYFNRR